MASKSPASASRGPSPLARGNLGSGQRCGLELGSIPARAGQPARPSICGARFGVHPRSRGATDIPTEGEDGASGPSPLARGNLKHAHQSSLDAGSIPARAGQPLRQRAKLRLDRVHPRSRGATHLTAAHFDRADGPSPLARGNRECQPHDALRGGSIPARAGQPPAQSVALPRPGVHPRSRGATTIERTCLLLTKGPSPLARGNRRRCPVCALDPRSIPARAGQPPSRGAHPRPPGVHPRSRGATVIVTRIVVVGWGPSPLARGNPVQLGRQALERGSIPARAGQPWWWARRARGCRVHPRSRGATVNFSIFIPISLGPSPLARGNHPHLVGVGADGGSIPARAGQPKRA